MSNLFGIAQKYDYLVSQIEENDGEITEEIAEELAIAESELEDKLRAYRQIIDAQKANIAYNKDEIKRILKEFVDRKILIENEDLYYFRIKFFNNWLVKYGTEKIIMTLTNEQKIQKRAKEEKDAKIDAIEIKKLIADIFIYQTAKSADSFFRRAHVVSALRLCRRFLFSE